MDFLGLLGDFRSSSTSVCSIFSINLANLVIFLSSNLLILLRMSYFWKLLAEKLVFILIFSAEFFLDIFAEIFDSLFSLKEINLFLSFLNLSLL